MAAANAAEAISDEQASEDLAPSEAAVGEPCAHVSIAGQIVDEEPDATKSVSEAAVNEEPGDGDEGAGDKEAVAKEAAIEGLNSDELIAEEAAGETAVSEDPVADGLADEESDGEGHTQFWNEVGQECAATENVREAKLLLELADKLKAEAEEARRQRANRPAVWLIAIGAGDGSKTCTSPTASTIR